MPDSNLRIYEAVRSVPPNAKKTIKGGRLKGYTDINPMWRLKSLTEQFGPAGLGWYYEITDKWLEKGAKDTIAAFVQINLFIKDGDEWSKPIVGVGGSSFVSSESSGLYTNDECFKMALTDAISVACKALGMGADVYWDGDRTKYDKPPAPNTPAIVCSKCGKKVAGTKTRTAAQVAEASRKATGHILCAICAKEWQSQQSQAGD